MFSVSSAGAGTFAGGVTIADGGLDVNGGDTEVLVLKATTIESTDTTDAGSSTTGALKTAGGLGVAEKAHIGKGLKVHTGGATVSAGGLTIEGGGATIDTGGATVTAGGATIADGGVSVANTANAVVLKAFSNKDSQTNTVMQVLAKETSGFDLIDAKTGATDAAGTNSVSKFKVTSAGAGTFAGGVTIADGGLDVNGGDTEVLVLKATTIEGTATTVTSSSTTGALKTAGGLGVQEKAHIGQGLTVDSGGATVTAGGAAITDTADAVVLTVQSSHASFTNDMMVLKSATTATATGDFDYIQAQTT